MAARAMWKHPSEETVATRSFLAHAPAELTAGPLRRLGEGIGKVVYASEHWVVKRDRSPSEILALVAVWKSIRRIEQYLPGRVGRRLLAKPSRQIHVLRVVFQAGMRVLPRGVWYGTHIGEVWHLYRERSARGEALARKHLEGTAILPETVEFPPTRVQVAGWPGWLTVQEATERVECTLYQRLRELAARADFEGVRVLLDRFLQLRQTGWRRGLFSVDTHLKNFGVTGDRVVLLDSGGLTDDWEEIEGRLSFEEVVAEPHIQIGLGRLLGSRPDIAADFNARWKEVVNRAEVRRALTEANAGRRRESSQVET